MFDDVSNFVNSVDATFLFTLIVSVFFLVLITILMIVFVIKYNRKRNPKGTNIKGNMVLEITWIVIPTILVLVMFWFGWEGYLEMVDVPEDAIPVNVTAKMWEWSFEYEDGTTTDTLYVPVNRPVKLILQSVDVNHSFFIPAFRLKKDVFPNTERIAWFQAKETGEYDIACSEYCGLNHSYMYSKIIVLPDEDFNNWMYGMSEEDLKLLNEMTKSDN
ncbi:MAG: cytochrome c oxidase subunit II [Ignavibacteria bacterium]|nr:cytochrome c oxidase subunit II [Ignavibacteria bacterium]MBT8380975.1 cytochrome c oxidase subunit II [Ignavibacteria bacterium]MBT8392207.1 cytochrome c oxidase subunit II [Ignavibacteria bacterium]NNJ53261.1 cytochrome c oxidase subunit II [Ignavibacteriaceae bacterium]NNL20734.1 cytochrome c oxidase subunit II [Ignavibacteriaceae bacterium]